MVEVAVGGKEETKMEQRREVGQRQWKKEN